MRIASKHNEGSAPDEGGFTLVWAAIVLLLLLTFAGFAIDIGNWQLQAAKLHRASDAAAMAGVVKMPDVVAAEAVALEAMKKNGVVENATVDITVTPVSSDRLSVEVTDSHVETIFASWVLDHISVTRKSTAKFREPIKMGNPTNHIGTGPMFEGTFKDAKYHGYWLAINGYCAAAERGDPYASRYDGNNGKLHGGLPTKCDSSQEINPLYRPITALDGGYNYIIEVPDGGQTQNIWVYDALLAPDVTRSGTTLKSSDINLKTPADTHDPVFNTDYRLYRTLDATKTDFSDDTWIASRSFAASYSTTDACLMAWCTIGTSSLPPGTYRLNVTTPDDGLARSYGVNTYAVRVAPSATGSPGFTFPGTNQYTCDSRDNQLCPRIYAVGAFSIQTHGGSSGEVANIYLADIGPEYAGSKMRVGLFDPGDGSASMQLLRPDIKCMPNNWSTPAKLNAGAMSGTASSEDCSTSTSKIIVSGTSTKITKRVHNWRFNDRWLTLNTSVPVNYDDVVSAAQGDTWWRIRYLPATSGYTGRDRTVWTLTMEDGSPVHLVRNP